MLSAQLRSGRVSLFSLLYRIFKEIHATHSNSFKQFYFDETSMHSVACLRSHRFSGTIFLFYRWFKTQVNQQLYAQRAHIAFDMDVDISMAVAVANKIHNFSLTLSRKMWPQTKTYVFNCIFTAATTRQKFDSFTIYIEENETNEASAVWCSAHWACSTIRLYTYM